MRKPWKGFATFSAVAILAFVLVLTLNSLGLWKSLLVNRKRLDNLVDSRYQTLKTLNSFLKTLGSWNPDEQTLDIWWDAHKLSWQNIKLISLSGQINLNTLSPFLLSDSLLKTTLNNHSVNDFVNFRLKEGLQAKVLSFSDLFTVTSLKTEYCSLSLFNVNTADEIMIEKVIDERTGDESLGSSFRSSLRQFRAQHQIMVQTDLDTLIGDAQGLQQLLTVEPEIDVNTATPFVLQALLEDPDFALTSADAKLNILLNGRQVKPWTKETLAQALGLDLQHSTLLQYLGTRTRFVEIDISTTHCLGHFQVMISYSPDSPPKLNFRILKKNMSFT